MINIDERVIARNHACMQNLNRKILTDTYKTSCSQWGVLKLLRQRTEFLLSNGLPGLKLHN